VRGAPEKGDEEREGDEPGAKPVVRDQARETAVADRADGDALLELGSGDQRGRRAGRDAGRDVRPRLGDLERALQEVLRVRAQAIADRFRGRAGRGQVRACAGANDDLLPSDASGIVVVSVDNEGMTV